MDFDKLTAMKEGLKQFAAMNPEAEALRKQLGGRPFVGTSISATLRRRERERCTLHQGVPGQEIEMSRGRKYQVASDGSFRRVKESR